VYVLCCMIQRTRVYEFLFFLGLKILIQAVYEGLDILRWLNYHGPCDVMKVLVGPFEELG
jgi:hypothetical protein